MRMAQSDEADMEGGGTLKVTEALWAGGVTVSDFWGAFLQH